MNKIENLPLRHDNGPRYIDPNAPITKQISVLDQLRKNPPENSRRVTITPDLAEHILLNLQDGNRKRRPTAVKQYADDMSNGRWRLTGDTIKFGKSGLLRDGQHRLTACVRSGVTFETYVLFGLEDDAFAVMDIGRKRDGSDTFVIAGIANAHTASAAARWDKILTGPEPTNRAQTFSNRELLEHYNTLNTKAFDASVAEAKKACRGQKELPESVVAAMTYLYRFKHPKALVHFYADLTAKKGGAMRLIKRLAAIRGQNMGRINETQRNAMLINALNCYVRGESITNDAIKWTDTEPFPAIAR